ncbi:MAG: hypothetical protein QOJ39_2469 [Candidatus Eremiobacteraeota bacterium]|nr:hypothetical protein [Candidatus Eremiobacteraeota bacterium]
MRNITPDAAQPRTTGVAPPRRAFPTQLVILVVAVILVVLLLRACIGGENKYEKTAHQLTQAVQNNDFAAVSKLENSQTAAEMGRGRLGKAADTLAPLGKIKKVHENTPSGDGVRVHEFDVTFDRGTVHEKILFDPEDKVFRFHYDPPATKK